MLVQIYRSITLITKGIRILSHCDLTVWAKNTVSVILGGIITNMQGPIVS